MQKFLMLEGLPASGKSFIANELKQEGYIILSSDEIREEIFNDVNDQKHNNDVFDILHKRMIENIKLRNNVVYDATNLSSKRRTNVLSLINKFDIYKEIIVVATPFEKCVENNERRERKVPQHVLDKMIRSFEMPFKFEGWDKINVVYPFEIDNLCKYNFTLQFFMERNFDIPQDNPHHTLSLQEHMEKAQQVMYTLSNNRNLHLAAVMHDIGKTHTKSFKDKHGNDTDICHYYGHENFGAYNALFYLYNKDNISYDDFFEIIFYIQHHMLGHQINSMKSTTIKKYKNLFGEEKFNNLMLLNKADSEAK